jgi:hypothetical protein
VKKPTKRPTNKGEQPLPKVNVEYATSGDAGMMTEEKMRSLMCNPIYAGVGPYPALVDDETWVRAAAQMIRKEGSEQFLVNMLYVLRQSLGTGVSGSKDHEDN